MTFWFQLLPSTFLLGGWKLLRAGESVPQWKHKKQSNEQSQKTWLPPGSAGIMKHKHGKKAFKVLSTCLEIHEPGSTAESICIKGQIRQKIVSQ